MKAILLLLLATVIVISADNNLNVFIIPHSHCDPGWLNTFEGYFRDQVNRILSGITDALYLDTNKKFIWAEISFFHLWYEQQPQEVRDTVKTIVKRGQLEFVAGGWVQNDEANANFDIVIDQVTEGHDFLHRVFGVVPRVAWQIDPFGHSSITPSLFSRMGFEALVINRIHHGLKGAFKESKSMEFLWTGSQSLGEQSEIFTHVLHTHYSAPQGFDWEESSPPINRQNVEGRARDLVNTLKSRANAYRTNNLLVTFGDDFKFQNPSVQFSNMDQIISEINSRSDFKVKIKYATVSEYFDAVNKAAKENSVKFPSYSGDFFPYADNDESYWTGYYTSRPFLKGHSRSTDSVIKAAEGMYSLGRMVATNSKNNNFIDSVDWNNHFAGIRQARRDAALVQHHDGITGTAKQFVADDYARRLDQAERACGKTITDMAKILLTDKETPSLSYDAKTFSFANGDEVYAIVVHNPLGWVRRKYLQIVVDIPDVSVTSHEGIVIDSQVMPTIELTTMEPTSSRYELYFLAEIPPLGLSTFFISKSKSSSFSSDHATFVKGFTGLGASQNLASAVIEIQNEHMKVVFSSDSGLIHSVLNKDTNDEVILKQEMLDYTTSRSGAYIMRPESQVPLYTNSPIKLVQITGDHVQQVCSYFYTSNVESAFETSVCVKIFSTRGIVSTPNVLEVGGFMEVTYNVVGRRNRETVSRFNTNLETNRGFFTDNGLEIRQRKGEGTRTENKYYPNLSFSYLQDAKKNIQFTILSRQAMGTHSRDEGMLEQMLHRALAQDDGRGLAEPNNDHSRIEVQVYLMVQPLEPSVRMGRRLALALQHQPRILHAEAPGGAKAWGNSYKHTFFPLASQLPHNIHLLSLKARDALTDDYIFRVVHIFETGQHSTYSQPKELEWDKIFQNFKFEFKRERSLALSMDVEEAQERRPKYITDGTLDHASGTAPKFVKQESQNTQEEGVFISQAALDDKQAKPPAPPPLPSSHSPSPLGRKLTALTLLPNDAVITMEAMQIKSYFVQIVPKTGGSGRVTQTEPIKPTQKPTQKPTPKPREPIKPTKSQVIPPKEDSSEVQPNQPNRPNIQPNSDSGDVRPQISESSDYVDNVSGPRLDPTPPSLIIVSELELKAFLVISVMGTGLILLAYSRLRGRRTNKRKIISV